MDKERGDYSRLSSDGREDNILDRMELEGKVGDDEILARARRIQAEILQASGDSKETGVEPDQDKNHRKKTAEAGGRRKRPSRRAGPRRLV